MHDQTERRERLIRVAVLLAVVLWLLYGAVVIVEELDDTGVAVAVIGFGLLACGLLAIPLLVRNRPERFRAATLSVGSACFVLFGLLALIGGFVFLPSALLLILAGVLGTSRWLEWPLALFAVLGTALVLLVVVGALVDAFG